MNQSMFSKNDQNPVSLSNQESDSPFLLICDHAGVLIPESLYDLGIQAENRYRHIAWDIGIGKVGEKLAALLGSTLVMQNYSRLVIDCNRCLDHPTLIVETSDHVLIPGNQNLTQDKREERIRSIYRPYHDCIESCIEKRGKKRQQTVLISLHSFTPEMDGYKRPWHVGVLHDAYSGFSLVFKKWLEESYPYPVGDNEPYVLSEKNDYSVPFHAFCRAMPYLELEIRQDLITTEKQQQEWAERLAVLLPQVLKEYAQHDTDYRKSKDRSRFGVASRTF